MSLKKIEQVKKDKFFKVWDIAVYGIIALIIAALFIAVALTSDKSELSGIEVYYDNNLAFRYSFEEDVYTVLLPENIKVEEETDESLTVLFCTDAGSLQQPSEYNIIYIDKSAKSVSVTDSDCSNRKDCVYTAAITNSSGIIICTPHRLRIVPSDYSDGGQSLPVG